jgi:histone acetyltransferase (RNA polymerase elongator complex component)
MPMSYSALVIPVFIPHRGCPHQCLFCNQNSITGKQSDLSKRQDVAGEIERTITTWLARSRGRGRVQVAFYGGSFTCLPRQEQDGMLQAVQPFLRRGEVDCIRLSTRPDCLDSEVCSFLREHGVAIVEVGVQSLDDGVLQRSRRGHTAADCRLAITVLQEAGIEVGVQLMPGLPGEGTLSFFRGVREIIALAPPFVRLYPALVVDHSGLAEIYRNGNYRPLTINRAVALCRRAKEMLTGAGIRVVRIGLHPSPSLEKELLAGPYHPAFGELVAARDWLQKIRALLAVHPGGERLTVRISERDLSAMVGPKRMNIRRLAQLGMADRLRIETDKEMQRGTLRYVVG